MRDKFGGQHFDKQQNPSAFPYATDFGLALNALGWESARAAGRAWCGSVNLQGSTHKDSLLNLKLNANLDYIGIGRRAIIIFSVNRADTGVMSVDDVVYPHVVTLTFLHSVSHV